MILENDLNERIAATLCGSFPMCPHDWMPITGDGGRLLWVCRRCAAETDALTEPHPALRVSSCPFCPNTHAPGKCPAAAGGGPWEELREARARVTELEIRLAEYRSVNTMATNALEKYHALYGALPERKDDANDIF